MSITVSHLVLCAGGVACCRYQQGLSSQLIGQGYCAEGQAKLSALLTTTVTAGQLQA